MKKKTNLTLNKETIQALQPEVQQKVKGGIYTLQYHPCNTNEDGCIWDTEWLC